MKNLPKKKICKWDKGTLQRALPILLASAADARYVCRKCGRLAADRKHLCKPVDASELDVN